MTVNQNQAYLDMLVSKDQPGSAYAKQQSASLAGIFLELAKLCYAKEKGIDVPFDPSRLDPAQEIILKRSDCYDFYLSGYILMHGLYADRLPKDQAERVRGIVLGAKYWIDEGGEESSPCYFTENHQMLHHTNEYLAGQYFMEDIFTNNGKSGAWHKEHAKVHLLRWLEWRTRLGYSEWCSNTYYHEDFQVLAALACFAKDEEVAKKSAIALDLLLLDMALGTHKNIFGMTHGRAYVHPVVNPQTESVLGIYNQVFGMGPVAETPWPGCVMAAVGGYEPAAAIAAIAKDTPKAQVHLQGVSLNVEDGKAYGYDPALVENTPLYWGMEGFCHRLVVDQTLSIPCVEGYYLHEKAKAFKANFELCERAGMPAIQDPDYTYMPRADLYTYRTADFMLSSAQDYRPGRFGFQQHVWQATLGGKAVVFTNHPGSNEYGERPNCWMGNRTMPKAVAYQNVQLCLYHIPVEKVPTFTFHTHAYFPTFAFDEVVERGGWIFGRKDKAYVAIRSLDGKPQWGRCDNEFYALISAKDTQGYKDLAERQPKYEIVSVGHDTAWICELGSEETYYTFAVFVDRICKAKVEGDIFNLTYESPLNGTMNIGWTKPLTVEGATINVHDYPRYDTPYCKAPFASRKYSIKAGDHTLELDFDAASRKA